jgi:hypothetical protein
MKINLYPSLSTYNNSQNTNSIKNQITFGGITTEVAKAKSKFFEPFEKPYNALTDKLAKGIGKIMKNEKVQEFVNKSRKSKHLVQHISALGSLITSGLYIQQTLTKKELDERKRKTLAINQGIIAIFSIVSSYTLDNWINKKTEKFINKFIARNATSESIGKLVSGIQCAKTLIIFNAISRFIVPVAVTPIANAIGNRLEEKHKIKNEA